MTDWTAWAQGQHDNPSRWIAEQALQQIDASSVRAACVHHEELDYGRSSAVQVVLATGAGLAIYTARIPAYERDRVSLTGRLHPWSTLLRVETTAGGPRGVDGPELEPERAVITFTGGPVELPLGNRTTLTPDETAVVAACLSGTPTA